MTRPRILLTGVSAFVGYHLCRQLSASGITIVGTYRTPNENVASLANLGCCDLIRMDLAHADAVAELDHAVDAIVHVAATSGASGVSCADLVRDNIEATRNLTNFALAARCTRFIYTSSLSVHGEVSEPVLSERTPIHNPSPYGLSKYLGELLLAEQGTISSLAIRLPAVLGVGARSHWVATLEEKARKNETIPIYNPEGRFNNAVHVDDLGATIGRALRTEWRGFYAVPVASDGFMTVREVVNKVIDRLGSGSIIDIRANGQSPFVVDDTEARLRFGHAPRSIERALDDYLTETLAAGGRR